MQTQLFQEDVSIGYDVMRFKSVITNICETNRIRQDTLTDLIDKSISEIHPKENVNHGFYFDKDQLNNLKRKSSRKISSWVLEALRNLYHVNPDYIIGTSDDMFDKAGITYDCFKTIFPEWKTVTANYRDPQGEDKIDKYLYLTCDSHLYDFLIKRASTQYMSMNETVSFNQDLEKYEKEFNDQKKANGEYYLLLPAEPYRNLLRHQISQEQNLSPDEDLMLHEVIDHANYFSLLLAEKESNE